MTIRAEANSSLGMIEEALAAGEMRLTALVASQLKGARNRLAAHANKIGLEHTDFTVISNDCWGQALYTEWGLPCRTPMMGSGMHAECYLRFLSDIQHYLASPLQFVQTSRYASVNRIRLRRHLWPIALLRGDIEVHFLHFYDEQAARETWEAGCRLVNYDRLAVKFSIDKDGAEQRHADEFACLPFARKLLISQHEHPNISCAIKVPNYIINGAMMFRRSLGCFDCAHWLNTGGVRRGGARVLLNRLLYARGA